MMYNKIYNDDCLHVLPKIQENSIDLILTDPPYMYLNHKLDRYFDEKLFFQECHRVLKNGGFLIFFGLGMAFHRWNVICDEIGFAYKDGIVWDKVNTTTPFLSILRVHENISIFSKGKGRLNTCRIDYLDDRKENNNCIGVWQDIQRIISSFKKIHTYDDFKKFKEYLPKLGKTKHSITTNPKLKTKDRGFTALTTIQQGLRIKSIIKVNREHYKMQHPTQKPQKLLKILIQLATKENDIVLDPFAGSGSTLKASIELQRKYIGIEIDKEYFELCEQNTKNIQQELKI